MAREYSPIRLDIWGDDDWTDLLSPAAQHLYFVLLTSPSLSYAGVGEWRPGRLSQKARGWSGSAVQRAAAELIEHLFIVVDEDTEEYLIRSFVKHDGLLKNPKTSVSFANAYADVASRALRGVIVHQLLRVRENQPELKGWKVDRVAEILTRKVVDPAAVPMPQGVAQAVAQGVAHPPAYPLDYPVGLGEGLGVGYPQTQGEGLGEGSLPAPAPAPSSSSKEGGYVSRERYEREQLSPGNEPPPSRCPRHPNGTADACGDCRTARLAAQADAAHARQQAADTRRTERETLAATKRAAIAECELCDTDGYRGNRVCDHIDRTAVAARGSAAVREVLAAKRVRAADPSDSNVAPDPLVSTEPSEQASVGTGEPGGDPDASTGRLAPVDPDASAEHESG